MPTETIEVFISYRWTEPSFGIANEIQRVFSENYPEIKFLRDNTEVGKYKGDIKEFVERLGNSRYVIVLISDDYLKSANCMFELVQLASKEDFRDRIFPIVLDDAWGIYKPAILARTYLKHWETESSELNQALKELQSLKYTQNLHANLNLYEKARTTLDGIVETIKWMNTLSQQAHQDGNYTDIAKSIVESAKAHVQPRVALPRGKGSKLRDIFKYACDRTSQLADFRAHRESTGGRQSFFFIYGPESESHLGFGNRIKMEIEGEFLKHTHKRLKCSLMTIRFPDATNINYGITEMLIRICDCFRLDPDQFLNLREKRFGNLLRQSHVTNRFRSQDLILLQILVNDFDLVAGHSPKVVEWINLQFFDRAHFDAGAPEVIIIWSVSANNLNQEEKEVRKKLKSLRKLGNNWFILPDLTPVDRKHVITWMQTHQPRLLTDEREELIKIHFVEQFPAKMQKVEGVLEILIANYNRK